MRPAKKRPERERSYLMLLVTGQAITCREALSIRLLTAYVLIRSRCYPCRRHPGLESFSIVCKGGSSCMSFWNGTVITLSYVQSTAPGAD